MDIVRKEIRQALLGDLVPVNNQLVVSGRRMAKFRYGLRDGIGNVLFLGVMCRKRWYMTKKSAKQIRELAVKAMQDMGRMVGLKSNPGMEAVYCAYLLNNPAILTFTQGKDAIIEITAYSGRGINGLIATFRTLNRFQRAMQDVMERMSETGESNRWNAIRQREMQDKQDQKLAKKKAKQEKKQAKKRGVKQQEVQAVQQMQQQAQTSQQMPRQAEQQAQQTNHAQRAGSFVQRMTGKLRQKQSVAQTATDTGQFETGKAETPQRLSAQERLAAGRAELEEAKLAAEEAALKLAAAEARLAAQEAEAKLEAVQARLAAEQTGETEKLKEQEEQQEQEEEILTEPGKEKWRSNGELSENIMEVFETKNKK